MKYLIFCLIYILFSISGISQTDSVVYRMVNKKLSNIENYLKDPKSVSPSKVRETIDFFSELTGVTSESDGNFAGQYSPTAHDYNRWSVWFFLNKSFLSWDEENKSIVLKKKVKTSTDD